MRTLFIRSKQFQWKIAFFYQISSEELLSVIHSLQESQITNVLLQDFIFASSINSGFTYTYPNKRTTIISINKCSSKNQFINTVTHECVHTMQHLKEQNLIKEDEQEAIFIGTLTQIILEEFFDFKDF